MSAVYFIGQVGVGGCRRNVVTFIIILLLGEFLSLHDRHVEL